MRVRLIPKGKKLIRLSLFYWLTYSLSVIVFTAIATLLSLVGVSQSVSFVTAFLLSSLLLISTYIRRFRGEIRRHPNKTPEFTFNHPSFTNQPDFVKWKISPFIFSNKHHDTMTQAPLPD